MVATSVEKMVTLPVSAPTPEEGEEEEEGPATSVVKRVTLRVNVPAVGVVVVEGVPATSVGRKATLRENVPAVGAAEEGEEVVLVINVVKKATFRGNAHKVSNSITKSLLT